MARFENLSDKVKQCEDGRGTGWTKRLDREQLAEIGGLGGLKCVVGEWFDFIFYSFMNFEPMEWFQVKSDVVVFGGFGDSTGESILISLEAVHLSDVQEKNIAVI